MESKLKSAQLGLLKISVLIKLYSFYVKESIEPMKIRRHKGTNREKGS